MKMLALIQAVKVAPMALAQAVQLLLLPLLIVAIRELSLLSMCLTRARYRAINLTPLIRQLVIIRCQALITKP